MTIELRRNIIRASPPSTWRPEVRPMTRHDEPPRYCASCGCKLRSTNRSRICDPCDTTAQIAHDKRQAWLAERGLL